MGEPNRIDDSIQLTYEFGGDEQEEDNTTALAEKQTTTSTITKNTTITKKTTKEDNPVTGLQDKHPKNTPQKPTKTGIKITPLRTSQRKKTSLKF